LEICRGEGSFEDNTNEVGHVCTWSEENTKALERLVLESKWVSKVVSLKRKEFIAGARRKCLKLIPA